MEEVYYGKPYSKLFIAFFCALMVAFLGFYTGQFIPPVYFIPLIVVELILIISLIFLRKKKAIGYPVMFAFMFISGCTLYPALTMYVSQLGADTVGKAIIITALSFAGIALYTVISKHDFRFLGGFLFISLFVLIGLGILNIFVPFGGQMNLIYSGFGILVFVGYALYDFSRLTHEGFGVEDIPMIIISIYLDFVNLLLFVLRFITASND